MQESRTAPTREARTLSKPPLARELFDFEPGLTWVMHSAEGPVPLASAAAVREFLPRETRPWRLRWEEDFIAMPRRVRRRAARLIGGKEEDTALVQTTTDGLATVSQGLVWQRGDEVVVPLGEFPSNAWPWISLSAHGVAFREVPLWDGHRAGAEAWSSVPPTAGVDPEARLLDALGPRTRLLSVSWVRFQDGLRLDLARLAEGCRDRGVILVVDGIQGAGTVPVDLGDEALRGTCAFTSGGHKGLLAPQGLGFLWTAPELRESLAPPGGWLSVEECTNWARPSTDFHRGWSEDASRLERGVPNLVGCAALGESLGLLCEAGVDAIHAHVSHFQRRLLERLAVSRGWAVEAHRLERLRQAGRLGSILAIHHSGRGSEALTKIFQDGMTRGAWGSLREGYLRLAIHGWHDEEDLERLAEWLEAA